MNKFKLIIASALLAISSQASALDFQYYGVIREFLEVDRVTGAGSNSTTSNENDRNPGLKLSNFISKVGFQLTEPLNDVSPGLKFKANVDTEFFVDSPTLGTTNVGPSRRENIIGNNRSTLGFENSWFDVEVGRKPHLVWQSLVKYGQANVNGLGDLEGTWLGEVHNRQKLRFNNGIFASVKTPIDGLTLLGNYSLSEKANVNDPYAYGANYKYGPFEIQAVHMDVRDNIAKSTVLATSYTFENKARLSFIASDDYYAVGNPNNTTLANTHTKGYSTALQYPLATKWSSEVSYGHRNDGVDAFGAGLRYYATKNMTFILQGNVTKSDNPIYFTTPVDFAGVYGTNRTNVGLGLEVKF